MLRRTVIAVLLIAMLNVIAGCHKTVKISDESKFRNENEKISKVALIDGRVITFDDQGGTYDSLYKMIAGYSVRVDSLAVTPDDSEGSRRHRRYRSNLIETQRVSEYVLIPMDSVMQAWVVRSDPVKSVLAGFAVTAIFAAVVIGIALATKESCPFVYSFDGEKYVFDAEPLGGAICEGLKRSECSRLDQLAVTDGQYRLKIRNEVPETQYLDRMDLLVVDHNEDEIIVPDTAGRLHVISEPTGPLTATDENGSDISAFVAARDGVAWQTKMTDSVLTGSSDLRHHLTFTFPKPANAERATLVFNAGTALWGSEMIKKMLQLRGSGVDEWYENVNAGGPAALELLLFNLREEMYVMKVYALQDSTYVERTLVLGGGPFMTEDRTIALDVRGLPGETLTLRLNPPKGFWTIDYLAVDYDDTVLAQPTVLSAAYGRDHVGRDITGLLASVDSDPYVMEEIGDWADIAFDAPPPGDLPRRSVFLRTDGYYEIHLDKQAPEQTALISELLKEPGAILEYSIQKFKEWKKEQFAADSRQ